MIDSKKKFIEFNYAFWRKAPINNNIVLVEGRRFSNQIVASGLIAKAIQEKENIPAVVWLSSQQDTSVYKSFEIEKFINKKKYMLQFFYYIAPRFVYTFFKFLFFNSDFKYFIEKYKVDGIILGDFIYDTYIRNDLSFLHPSFKSFKFIKIYSKTVIEFFAIKHLFKKYNVKYSIIAKWQYNNSGALMARYALYNNYKVISATFDGAQIIDDYRMTFSDNFKIYKINQADFNLNKVNKVIRKRFSSDALGVDVASAFSNDIWDKKKFEIHFGESYKSNNKNVFIMLHVFSDANHLSGRLIYRDYYKWFVDTIKIISKIPNVNWIIKEHPSSSQYHEEGIVKAYFHKHDYSNIFLLPENVNTMTVYNLADAVITARGTSALEASLFGIPAVLAGESVFSGLGFTHDMDSVKQYKKVLQNIENLNRLSKDKILLAKKTFSSYGFLMGSKLKDQENSWVCIPDFLPNQSKKEIDGIDDIFFEQIMNISIKYAGKNNPYYKDVAKKLQS